MKIDESKLLVEQALEEFELQIGAMFAETIPEPVCLYMSLEQLRKKSPDELAEYTLELHRYGLYLHRIINKLKAWDRWGTSVLKEAMALEIPKLQGYSWSERETLLNNSSEACRNINKFLREVRLKVDRLTGVPEHIKMIAESMRDMKFLALNREKQWTEST